MDYSTKTLVIMVLLLVLGIVIGMMMRSGGNRRLRHQLEEERIAHAATRRAQEERIQDIERTRIAPPRPRI